MTFPRTVSTLTLAVSAIVFVYASRRLPSMWPSVLRWTTRVLVVAILVLVGLIEGPLDGAFWSRDFSLVWLTVVVAVGVAAWLILSPIPMGGLADADLRSRSSAAPRAPGGRPVPDRGDIRDAPSAAGRREDGRQRTRRTLAVLLGAILALSLVLYVATARQILTRVNTDIERTDQSAYLTYAADLQRTGFTQLGDRNRMPVYQYLLAMTVERGGPSEATFREGKAMNLVLSILLLTAVAAVLWRNLGPAWAILLTEIAAWTLFVFKAPYVQAELLYYTLTMGLVVLIMRFMKRPRVGSAIAVGITAGLAHLTKASILPALVLLLVAIAGQAVWTAFRAGRDGAPPGRSLLPSAGYLLLIAGFFLLTVFPYIKNSHDRFGPWFYNVNSTFYMWYDSWDQATAGTKAHGDRLGWPVMPADEIPTPAKYWREHSPRQIFLRLSVNAQDILATAVDSYGYFKYIVLFIAAVALAAVVRPDAAKAIWREHTFLVLFWLAYFAGYFVLYAWFRPVLGHGNRLVLGLYLPFLVVGAGGLQTLLADRTIEVRSWRLRLLHGWFLVLAALLVSDVWAAIVERSLRLYGGA